MPGKSEPIGTHKMNPPLYILINEKEYSVEWSSYTRTASDPALESFTQKILNVFCVLIREINREGITPSQELCHELLVELAHQGMVAYRKFFKNPKARDQLNKSIAKWNLVPTFVSALMPFPWEILYEGDDHTQGDPKMFWGIRYTPARILNPNTSIHDYPDEQTLPLDMLFCLHHKLVQAHQEEQPAIEQLVRKTHSKSRFSVLSGARCGLNPKTSGKVLLEYFDASTHNIVHFASHCERDQRDDNDTLRFSLINDEQVDGDIPVISLKTDDFDLVISKFTYRPMIFLNACQSASGLPDELGKTFNLPTAFIEHEAAAVIATACPIPDLFAAAFARKFYYYFLDQHMTIGDALRATRWYFLEKHHNPLGLAYGLYSPAHYRLATSPAEGGARL